MIRKLTSKTREEWLENRKFGIGASEVATVLGINKWETPYQLWRRKVGLDEGKEENLAMKLGHLLEPVIATLWEEETGIKVIKNTEGDWMYYDDERPYLRVSPDRLYWLPGMKHNAKNKGILEIKSTQLPIDPDNIPQYWFCQVQYQMGLSGYHHATIAWLVSGRTFGYKEIEFNEEFYNFLVESIEDFWNNNVLANVPPVAITSEDVAMQFPEPERDKSTEVDEQVALDCEEYKSIKAQIDDLDKRKKELEESIKSSFTDGDAIAYSGLTLATWKMSKPSIKFDDKAFRADHPDIAEKYLKETPGSRRFSVK